MRSHNGNTALDPAGDNDGNVGQGESIELELDLANVGIETAMDVQVTITTADEWVVITDGAELAGDIDADGTLTLPGFALTWWPAWPTSTWRCLTWRWMWTATSGRPASMWC